MMLIVLLFFAIHCYASDKPNNIVAIAIENNESTHMNYDDLLTFIRASDTKKFKECFGSRSLSIETLKQLKKETKKIITQEESNSDHYANRATISFAVLFCCGFNAFFDANPQFKEHKDGSRYLDLNSLDFNSLVFINGVGVIGGIGSFIGYMIHQKIAENNSAKLSYIKKMIKNKIQSTESNTQG